ncbi:reverse transcriptase domain-containing protein [Tanacetum coccineum]
MSPWPFYKWGIDIAGPFPEGPGKVKFLKVAIDYFTKFGLPGEIISDNRKQFRDNPFKDWCEKLCIHKRFASVKHPQANGLVERANRSLGEVIKARLDEIRKYWIEEVPHVLWAHRTMIKTAEIDMVQNDEALEINIDLLEEARQKWKSTITPRSATQASSQETLCTGTMMLAMQEIAESLALSGKNRTK